jgi:hypothetical protein
MSGDGCSNCRYEDAGGCRYPLPARLPDCVIVDRAITFGPNTCDCWEPIPKVSGDAHPLRRLKEQGED